MLLLASLLAASAANAQVVFNNGDPDNQAGYLSDYRLGIFAADTFTFADTATFNTVTWFGGDLGLRNYQFDNFTIAFYDINPARITPNPAPRPGQTFAIGNRVTVTPTGGQIAGTAYDVLQFSSTLPSSLKFAAGTYGIGIYDLTSDSSNQWSWATSAQTGNHYSRDTYSGPYSEAPANWLSVCPTSPPPRNRQALP